jgi:hypothetical protein
MTTNPTYVFGVADAKISPLVTDAVGGATYGTAIDVPGIKSVTIKGTSTTKELRGDNRLLAKISTLDSVQVDIEFAKWDAELYALFTGATLTTDGNNWNVDLSANQSGVPFKLEAVSVGASGAGSNVNIILHKVIVTDLPDFLGFTEEDFKTVKVTADALPLVDGSWIGAGYNETGLSL